MKVCIIHGDRVAREILVRAFNRILDAQATAYSCCEDVLKSSLNYDIFFVYNNFGPKNMGGVRGTARIRARKSDAYIIGVSAKPYNDKKFLPAGADAFLLKAGNEIEELVKIVCRKDKFNPAPSRSGQ